MRHRPQRWDPTSSHMRQFPSVSFWHTEHHLSELHFPPATASIQNQHCYLGDIVALPHFEGKGVLFLCCCCSCNYSSWVRFKGKALAPQPENFPRRLALWETQKYGDKVKASHCFCIHSLSLSNKVDTKGQTSEKRRARTGVKSADKGHQALITASHWPWEEKKLFALHRNKQTH